MHNLFVFTTADSEDSDAMPQNTTFHQGLHCLLRQKRSSEKTLLYYLENVKREPWNYAMDHSEFIKSIQKEESISA